MRGARQNDRGCAYRSPADVPTRVRVDRLPGIASWEGRTFSYASAQQMMAHAASPAPKVDFWEDTPDGDPNVANLNALTNKAIDAVRGLDPAFLNTGGRLEEFTPLGGDMWRVYGVRRGLTEF